MADQLESQCETILGEFFASQTTNERKRELETHLDSFKQRDDAWMMACLFLQNSENPYLMWFATSIFERTIIQRWDLLSDVERSQLRSFIFDFLVQKFQKLPRFVKTKIAKVFVDIGKMDWPERYPEFFGQILSMVESPEHSSLGLTILLLVAEEFVGTQQRAVPSMRSHRRVQLKQLLVAQLGAIVAVLTRVLTASHAKLAAGQAVGPTMTDLVLSLSVLQQLMEWAPLREHLSPALLEILFALVSRGDGEEGPSMPALGCLTECLAPRCLPADLRPFLLAVSAHTVQMLTGIVAKKDASGLADIDEDFLLKFSEFMQVFLSQHLSRVEGHPDFPMESFLSLLFQYTFMQPQGDSFLAALRVWHVFLDFLLREKAKEEEAAAGTAPRAIPLAVYDSGMQMLLTELLKRVRFGGDASLLADLDDSDASAGAVSATAAEAAVSDDLGEGNGNGNGSGSGGEEDGEGAEGASELQQFLAVCVALLRKLCQLPSVAAILMEQCLPLAQAAWAVVAPSLATDGTAAAVAASSTAAQTAAVRDVCTLLQIAPCVVVHCCQPASFEPTTPAVCALVQFVAEVASASVTARLHTRGPAFLQLQVTTFRCLASFAPWLSTFDAYAHAGAAPRPDMAASLQALLSQLCTVCGNTLVSGLSPAPEPVAAAAVSLLRSLTTAVRPLCLPQLQPLAALHQDAYALSSGLALVVACDLYVALGNALLLPPRMQKGPDASQPQRAAAYGALVQPLLAPLAQASTDIQSAVMDVSILSRCRRSLAIAAALCRSLATSPTTSKRALTDALSPMLPSLLHLLLAALAVARHGSAPGGGAAGAALTARRAAAVASSCARTAHSILSFYHACFDALRKQIGAEYIQQALSQLLAFTSEAVPPPPPPAAAATAASASASVSGMALVSSTLVSLLRLLRAVLSEPTSTFHAMLPGVLQLLMGEPLKAAMAQGRHAVDMQAALFALLRVLLVQHWRFFIVKSRAAALPATAAAAGAAAASAAALPTMTQQSFTSPSAQASFCACMELMVASFRQADLAPRLFRFNLRTLQALQDSHRLFGVAMFKELMMGTFMHSIVQAMLSNSHHLLREEMSLLVFHMAAADFDSFFRSFLPSLLQADEQLTNPQRSALLESFGMHKDSPTFRRTLDHFLNDLCYHRAR